MSIYKADMLRFTSLDDYIRHFKRWIKVERDAQIAFHLNEIRRLSGPERERRGRAILNLLGTRQGRDPTGYYLVKYRRPQGPLPPNELRVGDVVLVSRGKPTGKEVTGTIVQKTSYTIVVAFTDPPPRYAYGKGIRLDLFVNDTPFKRMNEALDRLPENPLLANLVLLKTSLEQYDEPVDRWINASLNESQQKAVQRALQTRPAFLVHGPPGTGKTTTLTEVIVQLARRRQRILACADSNIAVDNLVERLVASGLQVVRIGHPARLLPTVQQVSLPHLITKHPDFHRLKQLREALDRLYQERNRWQAPTPRWRRGLSDREIHRLARANKPYRGVPARILQSMARWLKVHERIQPLYQELQRLEQHIIRDILRKADVVCATNVGAGQEVLADERFDVVVLDEATQSLEPACLIPMHKGGTFIMAGDHKQLPPTVIAHEAWQALSHTLFERLIEHYREEISEMLRIQYRMHEKIMRFPSEEFYEGKLVAHPSVAHRTLRDYPVHWQPSLLSDLQRQAWDPDEPLVWIDTAPDTERQKPQSTSFYNPEEAEKILHLLEALETLGLKPEDVGVISPYEDQVVLLRNKNTIQGLEIHTVDGFQGREKEAIILSLVRANHDGQIGFLQDLRRLNVAITRARSKLIVLGCSETVRHHPTYARFLAYVRQHGRWLPYHA